MRTQTIPTQEQVPTEQISATLEHHHRRLDDILDRVEIDVDAGDWSEARRGFSLFQRELEEHMRIEEEFLLPSLEVSGQVGHGPPAVMRAEHERIRVLLQGLETLLEAEQPIGDATDALEALLSEHNAKEECVLYPIFERMAPPEAYAALAVELRPLSSSR